MKELVARLLGRECEHDQVLVVRTGTVQREICERCGHLSFAIEAVPSGSKTSEEKLSRIVNL